MSIIRILLIILAILVILFGAVFAYGRVTSAKDRAATPSPGQLIQVDGHQRHLYCTGTGSPTVILESGLGDWSLAWVMVQPEIARLTRVCSYDRAGLGWSEAGPGPRDALQMARELDALLTAAAVEGPYVLVGHSAGGLYAQVFASQHPDQTAGLVLLDSPDETSQVPPYKDQMKMQMQVMAGMSKLGIFHLIGLFSSQDITSGSASFLPAYVSKLSSEDRTKYLVTSLDSFSEVANEWEGLGQSLEQLRAIQPLTDLPVIVLSSSETLKGAPQHHSAKLPDDADYRIVEDSSHFIQIDQPKKVVEAIQALLARQTTN